MMRLVRQHLPVVCAALFAASLLIVNACAAPQQGSANAQPQPAVNQRAMNNNEPRDASTNHATPDASHGETPTPDSGTSPAANADDLSFETSIRATGRDQLLINYTIKNRGRQPMLLMNRPPARGGASAPLPNPNFVYVETQSDGVVEISKRVREQPRETTVFMPDVPGATLLAPGQSFSEEVRVDLAARRRKSAQPVRDVPDIPDPVKRVRFCLGVAPSEGITTRSFGQGKNRTLYPDPGAVLMKQRVLCSETVELP
jgi:hypothetical protein